MPGPKPATRLFSRIKAFSAGSLQGELSEKPPGIAGLISFLVAEIRDGDSMVIDCLKKDYPVEFIYCCVCLIGVCSNVSNAGEFFPVVGKSCKALIAPISGEARCLKLNRGST